MPPLVDTDHEEEHDNDWKEQYNPKFNWNDLVDQETSHKRPAEDSWDDMEDGWSQVTKDLMNQELLDIFAKEEIQIHEVNFTNSVNDAAIINSGCARSCGGKAWTDIYLQTLSDYDYSKVQR